MGDTTFLIGDGVSVERLKRESRRLCSSKFTSVRRFSNYTRQRNSSLKSDLAKSVRGYEKAKSIKCSEIDRASANLLKRRIWNERSLRASAGAPTASTVEGEATLVDSRGPLVNSGGSLVDSRGTLVDSRETLVGHRGTLDNRGTSVDSRGTLRDGKSLKSALRTGELRSAVEKAATKKRAAFLSECQPERSVSTQARKPDSSFLTRGRGERNQTAPPAVHFKKPQVGQEGTSHGRMGPGCSKETGPLDPGRECQRESHNEMEASGVNCKQGSARFKSGKSQGWLGAVAKASSSPQKGSRGSKDVRLLARGESGREAGSRLKIPGVECKQERAGLDFSRSHSCAEFAGAPDPARTENGGKNFRWPNGRESQWRKAGNGKRPSSDLTRGSPGGSFDKSRTVWMRAVGTSTSSPEKGSGSVQRFESRQTAGDILPGLNLAGSILARKSKLQDTLRFTPQTAAAEEKGDQWMWDRFDSIMMSLKDFFKDRPYKPRSSTVDGSASLAAILLAMNVMKANPGKLQGPLGNLSALYFKYGTPDVITLRC